jgi:hypothetical protein
MPKDKEPIEVPASVAKAYQGASAEKRKRAEQAMATALKPREEAVGAFRNITERASEYAAEQGLTPEKIDELLRDQIEESPEENPYSWLKVLRNAKLSGPEDASVTYEKKLFGQQSENGE